MSDKDYTYEIDSSVTYQGIFKILDFILRDDSLEEIMYDGPEQPLRVYHKKYGMCDTSVKIDEQTAMSLIQWIVQYNRKTIGPNNPMFDGTLYEGSRVNITIPPASPKYPTITIRKFMTSLITSLDLIKWGTISEDTAAFIWTVVDGLGFRPSNILVVGGTGSGKTTFLNAITMFAPIKSRIITIEDTIELKVKHSNLLTMVSKTEQGVTMDMLLKNALRQRPDRIIVGEVRGAEAVTLFTAMNTGHEGCMGTLHANNARECIDRVTNPPMNVPQIMLNSLDMIIVLNKITTSQGGKRVVEEITEVSSSGGAVRFNQLFVYDAKKDKLVSTGVPSRIREKVSKRAGISAKDFDFVLNDRRQIMKRLLEIDKQRPVTENLLFSLLEKNRYHWQDELKKSTLEKFKSKIKRMQKKEDVLYL
jgi:archaeal flagellar protein FlaI